jgi:membrane protease YdiL (CAAX protease family)
MLRWGAAAYALLSLILLAISWWWLERLPFTHPDPWLSLAPGLAHAYSLLLGMAYAGAIVVGSRFSVSRFRWARRLHREFRPVAKQLSPTAIVWLSLLSALGEELAFRGMLQPAIGLPLQALLFGLVHQMPGPSRWIWSGWATLVGFGLGVIFELTGSLAGPVVAHAIVNGLNLSYLKHHDLARPEHSLGGLLRRQAPDPQGARE